MSKPRLASARSCQRHGHLWALLGVLIAVSWMWAPEVALAQQSAAERAAELNDEGKRLWKEEKDVASAAEKFRQATLLSPEGRYYFNLCYSLHQLSRYRDALTACEAVERNSTDEALLEKTRVVIADLRQRLPKTEPNPNVDPDPNVDPGPDPNTSDPYDPNTGEPVVDPDDPDQPDPNDPDDPDQPYEPPPPGGDGAPSYPDSGPPPEPLPELERVVGSSDDYNWSLGASLGFISASVGRDGLYGGTGAAVKLDANFIVVPDRKVGLQGYLGISSASGGEIDDGVQLFDVGGAIYKHFRRGRFYITPTVGGHFSLIQPDATVEAAATVGLHTQVALSLIIGPQRRHVFSVAPALNIYFPASGEDAMAIGLDESSVTLGMSIGYTLRFMTPFGQSPLIILE